LNLSPPSVWDFKAVHPKSERSYYVCNNHPAKMDGICGKKFIDQANKNMWHVKKIFPNRKLGKAICIQWDAIDLSCLKDQKVRNDA